MVILSYLFWFLVLCTFIALLIDGLLCNIVEGPYLKIAGNWTRNNAIHLFISNPMLVLSHPLIHSEAHGQLC